MNNLPNDMTETVPVSLKAITMYSTTWCGDCRRAKYMLKEWGIDFEEVDIERTPGAAEKVMGWANGKRVVPTILVDDRVLVNPRVMELASAIGVEI